MTGTMPTPEAKMSSGQAKCGTCGLREVCDPNDMVAYGADCIKFQCGSCYWKMNRNRDCKPIGDCPDKLPMKIHGRPKGGRGGS